MVDDKLGKILSYEKHIKYTLSPVLNYSFYDNMNLILDIIDDTELDEISDDVFAPSELNEKLNQ